MFRSLISFSSMTLVSRVLGLIRDLTINASFGATAASDAFWVAFRIPNFLRRLFAEGSFASAFVPVLVEVKSRRPQELPAFVANMLGILGAALLVVTAAGVLLAPSVASVFSFGDTDGEKAQLTSELLRITFPFIFFVSLTALAGSILNSFQKFAIPALTPVILNICMIIGAVWGSKVANPPIVAMGWAVLIAGILQLIFQIPSLARLGLFVWPRWNWRDSEVRKVLRLMVPTLFGSSVAQVNLLFDTFLAAALVAGSQTWLTQADRFLELPLGLFGIALGTVILPTLSRHHVSNDGGAFNDTLDWGMRVTLMISAPAMVGLATLAEPLVATMFQRGKFTAFDTNMAGMSVLALSVGLPAFALVKVLVPAFFSRQDTSTPVRAGIASLVANAVFNVVLLGALLSYKAQDWRDRGLMETLASTPGLHVALGLASALASYVNVLLLWSALTKQKGYIRSTGWISFLLRLCASCILMGCAIYCGLYFAPDFTLSAEVVRIGWLTALVALGSSVYVLSMLAFGFRPSDLSKL
ncbi:murein biosynthesis integral membrane protein MurJ [Xanthomonas sp. NCPPB 1638]|uniref:murein biosynthesis integral membrane protein MurJ n=1 Tax=Xanthomonas TaxID=338 RepID=UPI001AD7B568|nr:murein biosynthesis integral membrane protein MurJ [Xanthomonas cucurbitae]WDM73939.1 murein biosynthesis integral membrane protein MurJ [Xanthomonas cucurbitae]WDM80773.1 murein biosynthesis integral membrane protein MurJ [Xanthomonas cucurbitae]WDM84468.1 murein biosynthesis integral membrane protein MurJ [Xanthomonas cucurbitae]